MNRYDPGPSISADAEPASRGDVSRGELPSLKDRVKFVAVMATITYGINVCAIWFGIYFHSESSGSNLQPYLISIKHYAGAYGFWLPAFGYALVPASLYFALSAYVGLRKSSWPRWDSFVALLYVTHGILPAFSFAFIGAFVTTD